MNVFNIAKPYKSIPKIRAANASSQTTKQNSSITNRAKRDAVVLCFIEDRLRASGDTHRAKKWFLEKFPEEKVKEVSSTNDRIMIYDPQSKYAIESGTDKGWVDCVMHHHQDAKVILPIPVAVHDKSKIDGVSHSGGNAILDPSNDITDLIGFFSSPTAIKVGDKLEIEPKP